ncbi:target of rapamycin complex 1 subunit Tco89p [Monosporozyma servazzii]
MVHHGRVPEVERGSHPVSSMKHPRQFSTRSRAKSTASFKGLRRVLTHDTLNPMEREHHPHRIKSADSISRRRTMSGLNMTSLGLARSNPNMIVTSIEPTGSGSQSHSHSFGPTSPGIRPRRSKSTHSVLQYGEDAGLYNKIDDFASEEEVECFTDEEGNPIENEEEIGANGMMMSNIEEVDATDSKSIISGSKTRKSSVPNPISKKPEFTIGIDHEEIDSPTQYSANDHSNSNSDNDVTRTIIPKVDQKEVTLTEPTPGDAHNTLDQGSASNDSDKIINVGNAASFEDDNIPHKHESLDNLIIRKDSDDHIENADLSKIVSVNELNGSNSNELTRQVRNNNLTNSNSHNNDIINDFQRNNEISTTNEDLLVPDKEKQQSNHTNNIVLPTRHAKDEHQNNNIIDSEHVIKNSLTDQYIPNMILSQSTGMERTFEQPPSIQNSLSNQLRRQNDNIIPTSGAMNSTISEPDNNFNSFQNGKEDSHLRKPRNLSQQSDGDRQNPNETALDDSKNLDVQRSPQNMENKNKRNSFSNSFSSLTNNLQRANAAASLAMAASAASNSTKNKVKQNGTATIPENTSKPSSYISTIFNRRPASRQSNGRQEGNTSPDKVGPSLLSQLSNSTNKDSSITTKANLDDNLSNFSQFLKSENTDGGDSRTQRKLWLQRENSIMDLNLQNDTSADSIFMATNVDVKREFERISHEYTSLRRFYNPIDSALTRFEMNKDHIQPTLGKTSTNANIKSHARKNTNENEISQSLVSQGDNMFNAFTSGRSVTTKASENNSKGDDFFGNTQNSKIQRVLTTIWNQESVNFSNEVNPLSKNRSQIAGNGTVTPGGNVNPDIRQPHHNMGTHQSSILAARHSFRNAVGSNTNLHHPQRMINSLQPTTRAVSRRMENVSSTHQRA